MAYKPQYGEDTMSTAVDTGMIATTVQPMSFNQQPVAIGEPKENRAGHPCCPFFCACLNFFFLNIFCGLGACIFACLACSGYSGSNYKKGNKHLVSSLYCSLAGMFFAGLPFLLLFFILVIFQPLMFAHCGSSPFPADCTECFKPEAVASCGTQWVRTCCGICKTTSKIFALGQGSGDGNGLTEISGDVKDTATTIGCAAANAAAEELDKVLKGSFLNYLKKK